MGVSTGRTCDESLPGRAGVRNAGRERKRALSLTISAPACADSPSRFRSCCWPLRLLAPPITKSFRQTTAKDFEEGEATGSMIMPTGDVVPGMKSTAITLDAAFVWCGGDVARRQGVVFRHRRSGAHLRGRRRQRRRARAPGRDAGGVVGDRAGGAPRRHADRGNDARRARVRLQTGQGRQGGQGGPRRPARQSPRASRSRRCPPNTSGRWRSTTRPGPSTRRPAARARCSPSTPPASRARCGIRATNTSSR